MLQGTWHLAQLQTRHDYTDKSAKLKFLRGKIGLSKVSSSLTNLLEGIQYSGVWFLKEEDNYRAIICFKTPEQLDSLRNKLPSDKILNSGSLFLEYTGDDDDNSSGDDGGFWF